MKNDHRVLVVLIVNAVLYFFLNFSNGLLGPYNLHLTLDSLYLVFPALYFPVSRGFLICLLSGLVIDSMEPVPFGTNLIIFLIAFTLLCQFRVRFRRENAYHLAAIAFAANLLILLLFSLAAGHAFFWSGAYWIRFLSDLFFSQAVLLAVAAFHINFLKTILLFYGIDLASELRVG